MGLTPTPPGPPKPWSRPADVPTWMVCAVCGRVLELTNDPRDPWKHPTWMRTQPGGEDHAPDPVTRAGSPVVAEVCDFCMGENPTWELPTRNFPMPPGATLSFSDSGWAACDVCADLIRRNRWTQLTDRSLDLHASRFGPLAPYQRTVIRKIHRAVRANIIGDLRPTEARVEKGTYGDAPGAAPPELPTPTHYAGDGATRKPPERKP